MKSYFYQTLSGLFFPESSLRMVTFFNRHFLNRHLLNRHFLNGHFLNRHFEWSNDSSGLPTLTFPS